MLEKKEEMFLWFGVKARGNQKREEQRRGLKARSQVLMETVGASGAGGGCCYTGGVE